MRHNVNAFFGILALVVLLEMAFSRYSKSTLTSLEKEMHLSGKQLGLLGSGQQIGDLSVCLVISYIGGRGNRPKFLGIGCLLMTIGAMLAALPHLLIPTHSTSFTSLGWTPAICQAGSKTNNSVLLGNSVDKIKQYTGNDNARYYGLIMFGLVLFGVGMSALKPLGFSYLDDNIDRKRSALYLGIIVGTYYAGPILGFLLSAWTTSIWVDISTPKSQVKNIDPRNLQWISAWWLGYVIFGALILLFGLPFFCFPRNIKSGDESDELSSSQIKKNEEETKSLSVKETYSSVVENGAQTRFSPAKQEKQVERQENLSSDFFQKISDKPFFQKKNNKESNLTIKHHFSNFVTTGKMLISNRYFVLNVLGSAFLWFYVSVFSVFLIKFVEQQFAISTSKSNILCGLIPTPFTILGTTIGGFIINRRSLSLAGIFRLLLISTVLGVVTHCIGYFAISCNAATVVTQLDSLCLSQPCSCVDRFEPVCADGVTYSSACLIGCQNYTFIRHTRTYNFSSCSCLPDRDAPVAAGKCLGDCQSKIIQFIAIISIGAFFFGISSACSLIVIMRVLSRGNKSFGLGITLVSNKLLGAIPGPIIAGAIIDRACKFHIKQGGVCAVYDLLQLRIYFGTLLFVLKMLTVVVYAICVFLSRKEPSTRPTISGNLQPKVGDST